MNQDDTQSRTVSMNDRIEDIDANRRQNPNANEGSDNDYTQLDEQGYASLDEENDRDVASRGGDANLTQDIGASPPPGVADDAEVREGTLPVQDFDAQSQNDTEPLDDELPNLTE